MKNRLGFGQRLRKGLSNWRRRKDSWSKMTQKGRGLSLEPLEQRQLLSVTMEITNSCLSEEPSGVAPHAESTWAELTIKNTDEVYSARVWLSIVEEDYLVSDDLEIDCTSDPYLLGPGLSMTFDVVPLNDTITEPDYTYTISADYIYLLSPESEGHVDLNVTVEDNDDWKVGIEPIDTLAQETWKYDEINDTYNWAYFDLTRYGETDLTYPCTVTLRVDPDSTVTTARGTHSDKHSTHLLYGTTDLECFAFGEYGIGYGDNYVSGPYCGWEDPDTSLEGDEYFTFTFIIPAGEFSVPVRVIPDDLDTANSPTGRTAEPVEKLTLEVIQSVSCGISSEYYPTGSEGSITITIEDNDFAINASSKNAAEPKDIEDWDGISEVTDGATIGSFEIYRLSGFNLERDIAVLVSTGVAILDSDNDDPAILNGNGDYELLWATNDNQLIVGRIGYNGYYERDITFKADVKKHRIDVVPFYDTHGEPAEDVTMEIVAIYDNNGTPAYSVDNYTTVDWRLDDDTVTIAESPEKSCVCTCSLGDESGGSAVGANATTGNLAAGDAANNVTCYSYFANNQWIVKADSALTPTSGENNLAYVKAELVFKENAEDTNVDQTIWFDASGVEANEKYSFAFSADVSNLSTGIYSWNVILTEYYGEPDAYPAPLENSETISGTASIFNTADTTSSKNPVGNGWFIFDVPKLIAYGNHWLLLRGGLQLLESSGDHWVQKASDDTSDYLLELVGSEYVLTSKDGTIEIFDSNGLITSRIDSNGNETTYTFDEGEDEYDYIIEEPGGLKTTYTYNYNETRAAYELTEVTDPEGRLTEYVHDANGRITSMTKTDPDGVLGPLPAPVTYFGYDANGYLTTVTSPDGSVTEIEYDYAGCVKSVTYPDGSVVGYESYYTSLLADTTSAGSSYSNAVNLILKSDCQVTVTDPLGVTTTSDPGVWGFSNEVTDAEGNVTTYVRNGSGQVLQMIEPDPDGEGPQDVAITYCDYDYRGNLTKMTLPSGLTREWTYDAYTNTMTKYVDELGAVTLYDIDPDTGNTLEERIVIGQDDNESEEDDDIVTCYWYSPAPTSEDDIPGGLLIAEQEASGRIVGYTYDTAGRLLETFVYADSDEWITVDDSDTNDFSVTDGDWNTLAGKGYQYSESSEAEAKWVVSGLDTSEEYFVYVRWELHYDGSDRHLIENTTQASYSVYDGADTSGTPDLSETFDQTEMPDSRFIDGEWYKLVGSLTPTNTLATFVLTNDGDGVLVADSIVLLTADIVVDDSDTSPFSATIGTWDNAGNYQYSSESGAKAEWAVSGLNADEEYLVYVCWESQAGNTTGALYSVYDGTTSGDLVLTATFDQTEEPNICLADEKEYKYVGSVVLDGTTATVEISNTAGSGILVADSVCFVRRSTITTLPFDTVDDSDDGFDQTGGTGWDEDVTNGYHYTNNSSDTAEWQVTGLDTGEEYLVYVRWEGQVGNTTGALYSVYDGTDTSGDADLDDTFSQTVDPSIYLADKGPYECVGSIVLSNTIATVVISNDAGSGILVADEVCFVKASEIDDLVGSFNTISGCWAEDGSQYSSKNNTEVVEKVEWTIDGLEAGKTYEVFVTWDLCYYDGSVLDDPTELDNTAEATYSVYNGASATTAEFSITLDQTQRPAGHGGGGTGYQSIGRLTASDTSAKITLEYYDQYASGVLVADSVRFVEVTTESELVYDPTTGELIAEIDALGRVTEYEYDGLGRLIKVLEPFSQQEVSNNLYVNDGDADYADTSWASTSGGYEDDCRYVTNQSGQTATWTFTVESGIEYEVFTTWSELASATAAPYKIYNGNTGGTLIGEIDVDQSGDPEGDLTFGDVWQSLGSYQIEGTTLTIELTSLLDVTVVADAVMVVPRNYQEYYYDISGNQVATTDTTGLINGSAYDAGDQLIESYYYVNPDTYIDESTASTQWAIDELVAGTRYEVFVSWTAGSGNTDSGVYSLYDGDSTSAELVFEKQVNQQVVPGGHLVAGDAYRSIGYVTVSGNEILVTLTLGSGATGDLDAGTIRLVEIVTEATYTYDVQGNMVGMADANGNLTEYEYDVLGRVIKTHDPYEDLDSMVIQDDGDTLISSGTWTELTTGDVYGSSSWYSSGASYAQKAWSILDLEPGVPHELWVYYDANEELNSDQVAYVIYDGWIYGNDQLDLVVMDQSDESCGSVVHGENWHYLGTYTPTDDILSIYVKNDPRDTGRVIADAVMAVPARGSNETVYDAAGRVTMTVDALGNETVYEYDTSGQLIATTYPDADNRTEIDPVNILRAYNYTSGTGYIVYSEENIHERLSIFFDNSDHFVVVAYNEGEDKWYYDDRGTLTEFTPVSTDRIVATIDYTTDTITNLEGAEGEVNGIDTGYAYGDLRFVADYAGASYSSGDFTLLGSFFVASYEDNGSTYTSTYDAAGQLRGQADPLGHTTSSVYDETGRVVEDLYYVSTEGTTIDDGDTTGVTYSGTWELDTTRGSNDSQHYLEAGTSNGAVTWTFSGLDSDTQYELLATWDSSGIGYLEVDPTLTLDDEDTDYSEEYPSTWAEVIGSGNESDYRWSADSSAIATWTIGNLTAGGKYEIFATWVSDETNNTENALYDVYDGDDTSDPLVFSRVYDQKEEPAGHAVAGEGYQSLGYITVSDTSVTVTLSHDTGATGRLCADAIRLVEICAEAAVDARYDVYQTGTPGVNQPDATVTVNQNYTPVGDNVLGVGWKSLGLYTANTGSLYVQLSTDQATPAGSGQTPRYVLADAICLLEVETQTVYTYDTAGNLLSVTDALGNEMTYEYDEQGRLVQTIATDPDAEGDLESPVTYYHYNDADQMVAIVGPDLSVQTTEYDDAGRVVATYTGNVANADENSVGGTATWSPSSDGFLGDSQITTIGSDETATAEWTFDGLVVGKNYAVYATWTDAATATNVFYRVDIGTGIISISVDQNVSPSDDLSTSTAPFAFTDIPFENLCNFTAYKSEISVSFEHSANGQTIVADAVYIVCTDAVSTTVYDTAGRVSETQDADGNTTVYDYNQLSQVITVTYPDPDGTGTDYESPIGRTYYNRNGQVIATISSDMVVATIEYDALGRTTASYVGSVVNADENSVGGSATWSASSDGFLGDSQVAEIGTSESASTEWTFDGLVLGEEYSVFTTWTDEATATNVLYKVNEGESIIPSISKSVDQSVSPSNDLGTITSPIAFTDEPFELLGTFTATESEITVSFEHTTSGQTVVADAVYIVRTTPEAQIIYNLNGQVVAEIDADGNQTEYVYDSKGLLIETTLPDPDAEGPLPAPRTEYVYDVAGQLIETIEYPGESLPYDQRGEGYDRIANETVDIGAYESDYPDYVNMYTVDTTSDEIAEDGHISLREALEYASGNLGHDLIVFASGISTITLNSELTINSNVTIQGPGSGNLTINGNDSCRIFNINNCQTVEISGMTLTNGYVSGNDTYGGAIYCGVSEVTLKDVTITNSEADYGGAISANGYSDLLTIIDCSFTNNQADERGGAINTISTQTHIERTTISSNLASYGGGGVFCQHGSIEIVDSVLSGNSFLANGSHLGAALFIQYGENATITGTTFENNTGTYNAQNGGAIYFRSDGSDLIVEDCIISGNHANNQGGGIYANEGHVVISGTSITGNTATSYGGGACLWASAEITNSLFSGNTGSLGGGLFSNSDYEVDLTGTTLSGNTATNHGGGIYVGSSTVTLTNCTITGNSAPGYGGGIRQASGPVALYNTIVAGNTAPTYHGLDLYGTFDSDSAYNLIGIGTGSDITNDERGNIVGTNNEPKSANLGDLAYNGGPTKTHVPNVGSLAIDAGSEEFSESLFDARGAGFDRELGASVDIGAVEYGSAVIVVTTLDDEEVANSTLSLREAIDLANDRPGADVIEFSPGLFEDVTLPVSIGGPAGDANDDWLGTQISLTSDITIIGPGADKLVINAEEESRIFRVTEGANVTISGLTLTGGATYGATAVWAYKADVTLDSICVTDCYGGSLGAVYGQYSNLTVLNSEISGNDGDGVRLQGGTGKFYQTTISGNDSTGSGNDGSGVRVSSSNIEFVNCTVTGNESDLNGGGINIVSGTVLLHNTIVAGNSATTSGPDIYGTVDSSSAYNLIGDGTGMSGITNDTNGNLVGGSGAASIVPILGDLAYNGGTTRTHALLVIDENGNLTTNPAIDAGSNELAVSADGRHTFYAYDDYGRLESVVQQIGLLDSASSETDDPVTEYTYDAVGNVLTTTTYIDGINDQVTTNEYDNLYRLVKTIDATDGDTRSVGDQGSGAPVHGTSGTAYVMYSEEIVEDRFSTSSSNADHFITVVYNEVSETWQFDDGTNYQDFEPVASDRLVAVIDDLATPTTITSLLGTNEVVHGIISGYASGTLGFSHSGNYFVVTGSSFETNSPTTFYTYDAASRMASLTDPDANITLWTYGITGQVATETIVVESSDLTRYYEYDARGNLVRSVDRNDRVIVYEYDDLGLVTSEKWYNSLADANVPQNCQQTYEYEYDVAGRLVSVDDGSVDYDYTYDSFGRLASATQDLSSLDHDVQFDYTYNALGLVSSVAASMIDDSTQVVTTDYVNTYNYDNLGRVTRITQSGNDVAEKLVELVYDEWGQLDEILRYADLDATKLVAETELDYDDLGRVTEISHENADDILAQYNLTWDAAGRLVEFDFDSLVGDCGDTTYTYDETGQLTGVDYVDDWLGDESYTYDDNGNRITANGDSYETGDHNRLMDDGTYRYEYDGEGNRTLRYVDDGDDVFDDGDTDITEYEWDHRNRLVSVATYDDYDQYDDDHELPTTLVEYDYDVQNQLIGRTVSGEIEGLMTLDSEEVYINQGGQIVLHYEDDAAGPLDETDLSHRYLWGTNTDELLADEIVDDGTSDDVLWALGDHLNSVRDLVQYDDNGTPTDLSDDTVVVREHNVYDAYGNRTSETEYDTDGDPLGTTGNIDSLFLYTGRLLDPETGLQNNLNRWYDLSTGRWMSVDPIGFAGNDVNLYRYCRNGSTYAVDPTGLADFEVEAEYNRAKKSVALQKLLKVKEGQIYNDWGQPYFLASGSILNNPSGAATRTVIKGTGKSGYACNTTQGTLGPDGGAFNVTIKPIRTMLMPLGGYWEAHIFTEYTVKAKGKIYHAGHIKIVPKITGPGLSITKPYGEINPAPENDFSGPGGTRVSAGYAKPKNVNMVKHYAKTHLIRWAAGTESPHLPEPTATLHWNLSIGVKCAEGQAEAEGRIRVLSVRFVNAPLPKAPTPQQNDGDGTKTGK